MELDPFSCILLFILILLVAGLLLKGRKPVGNVIAFVGLSDAGKTCMVAKLATGDKAEPDTQLSIVSNQIEYDIDEKKKKLQLVDIPGNEKIRLNELEKYKVEVTAF